MAALVYLLILAFVSFQTREPEPERLTANPCKMKTNCRDCIASDPRCAWCSKEDLEEEGITTRCDLVLSLKHSQCGIENIVYPVNAVERKKSKPLSKAGGILEEVVQLSPQEVNLKLRPKVPYKLEVKFREAEDYPVDLYYIVDLSKSMEDDKEKLTSLGNLLAYQIPAMSKNFRLGFGSFVRKTNSTVPAKLGEAPYAFKNHMSLASDTASFESEVRSARVSGNSDAADGGLDAIMQSIVCDYQIGWRQKSRKILVVSTDSGFHFAGDGKLGGITRNDGACYLDSYGLYTKSTTEDYPSLSQLRHTISERRVNVIFAVTASQLEVYNELSKNLEGAYTAQLAIDSSNVVDLIHNQYQKTTSAVELRDTANENVKVTYYSKCVGGEMEKTHICKGLHVGTEVEFTAEIEVISCPKKNGKRFQDFIIYPVGLIGALKVHLEMICECDCELPHNMELFSRKCSSSGTYQCGVCTCPYHRFGRRCECTSNEEEHDRTLCQMGNSSLVCSGRGECSCGACQCFKRHNPEEVVDGYYCECDNFSCDRVGGKICGGEQRGLCVCSKCQCFPGWFGDVCQHRE